MRVGRYVLYDAIGAGGMGTVYLGRVSGIAGFSRFVAIKQLHPHLARAGDFVDAFLDEARLAARLHHPNVMPTLDVVAENGALFIVMEYVRGVTLSDLRRAPPPIAAAIVHGVLEGLHAAHIEPLGIIHRDVTPHNVLVGIDGIPRVLDFGIAKAAGRLHATAPGAIKGKMPYMAPEQLALEESSPRSDVYAAGAVLWELLTGRRLFDGANDVALIGKILNDPIPLPSRLADVSAPLESVVLRALRRNADERFATAREFAMALERALPLASAREVGNFVEGRAQPALHRQAQALAAIERAIATEMLDDDGRQSNAELLTMSDIRPLPRERIPPVLRIVALAAATTLVLLSFFAFRHPPREPTEIQIIPGASAAPVQSVMTEAPPQPSRSSQPPVPLPKPRRPPPPISKAMPPASSPTPCSPPHYFDDAGIKHLKRECL